MEIASGVIQQPISLLLFDMNARADTGRELLLDFFGPLAGGEGQWEQIFFRLGVEEIHGQENEKELFAFRRNWNQIADRSRLDFPCLGGEPTPMAQEFRQTPFERRAQRIGQRFGPILIYGQRLAPLDPKRK